MATRVSAAVTDTECDSCGEYDIVWLGNAEGVIEASGVSVKLEGGESDDEGALD